MAIKYYMLYCEICEYKRRTDGSDIQDLYEAKLSPIPTGVPKINPQTKQVDVPKPKKPLKRFRCPQCGRQITPKRLYEPAPPVPTDDPLDVGDTNGENITS